VLCDPPLSQSKKPSATTVLELQVGFNMLKLRAETVCAVMVFSYLCGAHMFANLGKCVNNSVCFSLQMKACADTLEAYVGGLYVEKVFSLFTSSVPTWSKVAASISTRAGIGNKIYE